MQRKRFTLAVPGRCEVKKEELRVQDEPVDTVGEPGWMVELGGEAGAPAKVQGKVLYQKIQNNTKMHLA